MEKAREFQKNIYSCFIDCTKASDCVDHTNCEKFLKRWEYQTILPVSWEICMQVKEQQLESDISNHLEPMDGSKLGKEYIKAVYCHPAYLTSMLGWMNHQLELRLRYQQPHICRWYHRNGRKWRGTKQPLDESERGEWKNCLKTQYSENEDHVIWSHHFMANR